MNFTGVFTKMQSEFDRPVQYYLDTDNDFIHVNQLMGRKLEIAHTGYQCMNCGLDKPIFRMGYCKNCFFIVPQTSSFVLRPEESKAHLDEEVIDLDWEKQMQLQPHIVYLANTGGLKVGVTRKTQVPTRWIDQGATQALPFIEVENRYLAGISEVAIAEHISDKTNYRKMLSKNIPEINLEEWRTKLTSFLPEETRDEVLDEAETVDIEFPIDHFPPQIKSMTLVKHPKIEGVLKGVKGQYWIFEEGWVFNVRNHEGYAFSLTLS